MTSVPSVRRELIGIEIERENGSPGVAGARATILLNLSGGQEEPDKWPLVLARDCGWATSDHVGRRGRVSFDG